MFPEHLPITAYSTSEGLAHNHINRIRQDSRGYLWFCTDGGLTRFDGYQFINYTTDDGLPSPWVNDLLETRDGTYWIATDGGVCRFNPDGRRTGRSAMEGNSFLPASGKSRAVAEPMFVVYHPGPGEDASKVNALLEATPAGVWCATYAGLYRFQATGDNVSFESANIGLPRNGYLCGLVNNLALDHNGTLWITARYGLFRLFHGGRIEHYTSAHGLPPDYYVETVFQDHDGRWWVGTRSGGFCSVVSNPDPERRLTRGCYSIADGLPGNDVRSFGESSAGRLWIGTTGGLSEFDPSTRRFRNYTAANGLSSEVIYKLSEDREGNLWIGTRDNGVMKMAGNGFVTYARQQGFLTGNADAEIVEDLNGEVCVITAVGARAFIERFDGMGFVATEISLPRTDPRSAVWLRPGSFQDREGEWWVATTNGLYRFPKTRHVEDLGRLRPQFVYDVTHGLQGSALTRTYPDPRGDIWVATENYHQTEDHYDSDLARWDSAAGNLHHYVTPKRLLQGTKNVVTALREDASGNLWVGFDHGGGLVRYRSGRFELFPGEAFKGLIRDILVDHSGRVWVATTQAGLSRIDNPNSEHPHLVQFTTADGLSSNEVRCITEDRFGRIYVGTNRGVDQLNNTSSAGKTEPLRVNHYTWADGLVKGTVHSAFRDRQGTLWFVNNDGISRFVPQPDRDVTLPPILITGLRVMGVPQLLSQLGEPHIANLRLPPFRNEFEVEFLSSDFRPGARLLYQYKLEGITGQWSTPSDERRVHYAGVMPGVYRFLVRAVSSEGKSSPLPATLSITVLDPFWRTWWFISLEATMVGLVVYVIYRYRLAQLLALERIRTRIAADLHDDIGSSLSQVAILSEVVRRRIDESDPEINAPLTRIGEISRDLVDSMGDIVWAINPTKDKLYYLAQRIRDFADDVFAADDVHFQFRAPDRDHNPAIGADTRRQVFLILKECIHNIIRHAKCTRVDIEIRIEGKRLLVEVHDNGVGFEPCTAVNGHGLASMQDRARRLGGKITFAARDHGTAVTLDVPLATSGQPSESA